MIFASEPLARLGRGSRGAIRGQLVAAVLAALAALTTPAAADTSAQERAAAQALFEEARSLAQQGRHAEACPKFRESQSLDPGIGTLYNLGDCLEKTGKTAGAWAAFHEAADMARLASQPDREKAARQRALALEPSLMRLRVDVPEQARVDGLEVRRDGILIGQGQWGLAVPADPGQHTVVVTAPGKLTRELRIELADPGTTQTVQIPPLQDAPAAVAAPAPPPAAPSPTPIAYREQPDPPRGNPERDTTRLWGYAVGGAGVIGLGLGALLAIDARSKYDDSLAYCDESDPDRCTQEGVAIRDDARSRGDVATIAFGLGTAALTAGVVIVLMAPEAREESSSLEMAPAVGTSSGGFTMRGTW